MKTKLKVLVLGLLLTASAAHAGIDFDHVIVEGTVESWDESGVMIHTTHNQLLIVPRSAMPTKFVEDQKIHIEVPESQIRLAPVEQIRQRQRRNKPAPQSS